MKFNLSLIAASLAVSVNTKDTEAVIAPVGDQEPSKVGVTVDGNIDDWNLDSDSFLPMHEAGKTDKELASKAYIRSNCVSNTLCILVLAEGNIVIEESDDDSWYKNYDISSNPQDGPMEYVKNDSGVTVGWEGCFKTSETGVLKNYEIHANYGNGQTTSTGKKTGNLDLDISCEKDYVPPADEPEQPAEEEDPEQPAEEEDPEQPAEEEDPEQPAEEEDPEQPAEEEDPQPPLGDGNTRGTPEDREGGGGYGDPHLKTWTGAHYEFHGGCDLILVKSEKFHKGTGLEIQIRTEIRRDWSFIAHTAIRIGKDVLEVGSQGAFAINGIAGDKLTENADLHDIGGFPVKYKHFGTHRHRFEIDLGDKQKAIVKVYNEFLAVSVENAEEEDFGDAIGMMGHFHTGKLIGREGDEITDTKEFGFDWQVRDTETMLFMEVEGPQYPAVCHMPSPKAIKRRKRRLSESMVSYDDAEKACASWEEEARESCIYDVLSTGDLSMADAGAF